jgi:hypothetical protein
VVRSKEPALRNTAMKRSVSCRVTPIACFCPRRYFYPSRPTDIGEDEKIAENLLVIRPKELAKVYFYNWEREKEHSSLYIG